MLQFQQQIIQQQQQWQWMQQQLLQQQQQWQQQQLQRPQETENLLAKVLQTVTQRPGTSTPKLPMFNGSENYQHFRDLFDEVAREEGWSDSEKFRKLITQLTGQALAVMTALKRDSTPLTFRALDDALSRRFCRIKGEHEITAEFKALKQGSMTIYEFAQKVQQVGLDHLEGMVERKQQQALIQAFHDGLENAEARTAVKCAMATPGQTLEGVLEAVGVWLSLGKGEKDDKNRKVRIVKCKEEEEPTLPQTATSTYVHMLTQQPNWTSNTQRPLRRRSRHGNQPSTPDTVAKEPVATVEKGDVEGQETRTPRATTAAKFADNQGTGGYNVPGKTHTARIAAAKDTLRIAVGTSKANPDAPGPHLAHTVTEPHPTLLRITRQHGTQQRSKYKQR